MAKLMPDRIIYLHGFASGPSSSKAHFFQRRLEAAGFLVAVPDLTRGDFERLTISGQLEEAGRVAREWAEAGPVSMIGSSMGGYLAALYAARHPEVERLALLAPAFGFARRWMETMGASRMEEWRREGTIEVYHYGEGRPRALGFQLLEDAQQFEDYPDVRQPCLIYHGILDDVVPVGYSRQFAAAKPNVELHEVNSGHDLLDALEEMGPRVEEFLRART